MDIQEIIKTLSKSREPRATIYLNNNSIRQLFSQRVSAVRELVNSEQLSGRLSAGLFSFLKSEIGTQLADSQKIELDPLLQAILIEEVEKNAGNLIDLKNDKPGPGSLIYYTGNLNIAIEKADISKEKKDDLPGTFIEAVSDEAHRQEKIIKKENHELEVVTFYWMTGKDGYAAVASNKWIDYGTLASYGFSPIGLLGRLESIKNKIAFIAPLWVWHDGW